MTSWEPKRRYDVWHDRAAFHFLTNPADQRAYAATLRAALNPGSVAIIGTFALDRPEKCSGLTVTRHNAASIAKVLGTGFEPIGERRYMHTTPGGSQQQFQFATFRGRA